MTCEGCKASKVREKKGGWAGKEGGGEGGGRWEDGEEP